MIKSESYYNERIRFSLKKGIQLGKVMGRIQAFEEFKEMINSVTEEDLKAPETAEAPQEPQEQPANQESIQDY